MDSYGRILGRAQQIPVGPVFFSLGCHENSGRTGKGKFGGGRRRAKKVRWWMRVMIGADKYHLQRESSLPSLIASKRKVLTRTCARTGKRGRTGPLAERRWGKGRGDGKGPGDWLVQEHGPEILKSLSWGVGTVVSSWVGLLGVLVGHLRNGLADAWCYVPWSEASEGPALYPHHALRTWSLWHLS
jgi:hypothetical protein